MEGTADQEMSVLADFLAALRGEKLFKSVLGEARDYMVEGEIT